MKVPSLLDVGEEEGNKGRHCHAHVLIDREELLDERGDEDEVRVPQALDEVEDVSDVLPHLQFEVLHEECEDAEDVVVDTCTLGIVGDAEEQRKCLRQEDCKSAWMRVDDQSNCVKQLSHMVCAPLLQLLFNLLQ